ncbi:hypothetical protein [Streptomyces sp. gb14]|uniref:hypothetical protein n=1 Tax=Streptomyces sp. gb14 TaxID=1827753 RepID=UPI00117CA3A0|nr:hypothetical protein [Streptomyces sp. gb14]
MTWRTVKQLTEAKAPEELFTGQWQNRPSVPDDYKPNLDDRWNEGCTNAWKLWQETVPLGYKGSYQRVRAYLHKKRTSPRPGARGPAAAGRVPAGTGRLKRLHRVAGPVPDPARLALCLGEDGVTLVDGPGVRGHPEERRALAAVQEVPVVLTLRPRERRHGFAEEVGVDLLAVVQPDTGPLRVDRLRETFGRVRLQSGPYGRPAAPDRADTVAGPRGRPRSQRRPRRPGAGRDCP